MSRPLIWVAGLAGVGIAGYYIWRYWLATPTTGSVPEESALDKGKDLIPSSGFVPYPWGTADRPNPDPDDVEGLARCLASEAPADSYTSDERTAICFCAMNWANRRKRTIAQIMLPPHHQKGYWCSTFQEASQDDTQLAYECLNGDHGDPTDGAYSFFEPDEQDRDQKLGLAGVTKTADQLRAKWVGEGLALKTTVGRWEFYG